MVTSKQLQEIYDSLNEIYFDNSLPSCTVYAVNMNVIKSRTTLEKQDDGSKRVVIHVKDSLGPIGAEKALLMEMSDLWKIDNNTYGLGGPCDVVDWRIKLALDAQK